MKTTDISFLHLLDFFDSLIDDVGSGQLLSIQYRILLVFLLLFSVVMILLKV